MLFRRKAKDSTPKASSASSKKITSDRRRQYRRRSSSTQDLRIHLHVGQIVHQGVVVDLSMFGCGVAFVRDQNPRLGLGDVAEVTVTSTHYGRICTPARVVWARTADEGGFRYGLEFISMGSLYAQMNSFYARLFNRRRAPRVKPPLDRRIACRIVWGGKEIAGSIREVSATGTSVSLTKEAGRALHKNEVVNVSFKLPSSSEEIRGSGVVRNRSDLSDTILFGIEFDLKQEGGIAQHLGEIEAFVEDRLVDMERWESNWSKLG